MHCPSYWRGSDLASNTSTTTLIYLSANQMGWAYPIDQSNYLKLEKGDSRGRGSQI